MLFYLDYIEHDVEKLHELLNFFFTNLESKEVSTFNSSLLPDWYSQTEGRCENLEKLLEQFIAFSEEDKERIIKAFRKCNNIEPFFSNKTGDYADIPIGLDFIKRVGVRKADHSIKNFLNSLFVETLYKGQLGSKKSTFSKKINSNLNDHYDKLKTGTGFRLCPFCGIEPLKMLESEGRADYDHLLPKGDSLYVFSTINLQNLVPIGLICNKKKDTKNLLYYENERITRKLAFYPYQNYASHHPFEQYYFKLECLEIPSYSNKWRGKWSVTIVPNIADDESTLEKIESWQRIYNIDARYAEYIEENFDSLLQRVLSNIDETASNLKLEVIKKLKYFLTNAYVYNHLFLKTEEGLIPRRILIEWLLKDETYLISYVENKKRINTEVTLSGDMFEA